MEKAARDQHGREFWGETEEFQLHHGACWGILVFCTANCLYSATTPEKNSGLCKLAPLSQNRSTPLAATSASAASQQRPFLQSCLCRVCRRQWSCLFPLCSFNICTFFRTLQMRSLNLEEDYLTSEEEDAETGMTYVCTANMYVWYAPNICCA